MMKNIIFDIGNVILNFNISRVLTEFTTNKEEQDFIFENIINSPEWLKYSLIDTGYIKREEVIVIQQDRTNHVKDKLIYNFWNHYIEYSYINKDVLNLIQELKNNNYKVFLLSNINQYMYDFIKPCGLFELVDGYVLSYKEHKVKPYLGIYSVLIDRYNLNPKECFFIDDKTENVKTANELGMLGKKVEPDNYESIINLLKEYNINFL